MKRCTVKELVKSPVPDVVKTMSVPLPQLSVPGGMPGTDWHTPSVAFCVYPLPATVTAWKSTSPVFGVTLRFRETCAEAHGTESARNPTTTPSAPSVFRMSHPLGSYPRVVPQRRPDVEC